MLQCVVRRCLAILVLAAFCLLGSGALGWVHDLAHAHEDAALAGDQPGEPAAPPHHDQTNCVLHALLRAPIAAAAAVPLLVLAGIFVAFLSLVSPQPAARRLPVRIDCRGPPVLR